MELSDAPYTYKDCHIGSFEAYICPECQSIYYTEEVMKDITKEADKIRCINTVIYYCISERDRIIKQWKESEYLRIYISR